MYSVRDKFIKFPSTVEEVEKVMKSYNKVHLPGCIGRIDVVHIKWANCPAGDLNRAKRKESYTTLAYEVMTNNDREIFAIARVQFGTRNDKHIVKLDENVKKNNEHWYRHIIWTYHDMDGNEHQEEGVYLICNGGYLRWPTLICPFKNADKTSKHGYFTTNLESVRKDVECTLGILKKRWRILDYGLKYCKMADCEKVSAVCCALNNMMLDEMDRDTSNRVRYNAPTNNVNDKRQHHRHDIH